MTASDLRARARQSLKGNYWTAVMVAFVAAIFGSLLNGGGFSIDIDADAMKDLFGKIPRIVTLYLAFVGSFASVLSIVTFVLGGVVQLGYVKYLLNQHDGQPCDVKDLFSMFHMFTKGFLQALLRGIYVFLWTLLFIIPGIVKAYSYAMTPFIMVENPELTANEAITASRTLMDGHKGDLFTLDLSFIGWRLLCCLTFGIGIFFLNPYTNAARAAFYRDLVPAPAATVEPTFFEDGL